MCSRTASPPPRGPQGAGTSHLPRPGVGAGRALPGSPGVLWRAKPREGQTSDREAQGGSVQPEGTAACPRPASGRACVPGAQTRGGSCVCAQTFPRAKIGSLGGQLIRTRSQPLRRQVPPAGRGDPGFVPLGVSRGGRCLRCSAPHSYCSGPTRRERSPRPESPRPRRTAGKQTVRSDGDRGEA